LPSEALLGPGFDAPDEEPTITTPVHETLPPEALAEALRSESGRDTRASQPSAPSLADWARAFLEVGDVADLRPRAFDLWRRSFDRSACLLVDQHDVVGAESAGLPPSLARRLRGDRLPARAHWILDDAVRRRKVYLGPGAAEVGSTWITTRLGLAEKARIAAVPMEDARGEVVAVLVGHGPRLPMDARILELVRASVAAGHRLLHARGALLRLKAASEVARP
jgi:hypothetical protein